MLKVFRKREGGREVLVEGGGRGSDPLNWWSDIIHTTPVIHSLSALDFDCISPFICKRTARTFL